MAISKLSTSSISGTKKSRASTNDLFDFPVGIGQYGLNNNTTNTGMYGGITSNSATFTTSTTKFGTHALDFNGTSGYTYVQIPPNLQTMTVAFWVYVRDTSQRSYIVDFRPGSGDVGYWLYDNNGTSTYGGNNENTFNYSPTLNVWQHWALVIDGASGTMTWYLNGSVLSSASRLCMANNAGYFTLGTYSGVVGGNQDQYFANMIVDNLYVSDKALTANQITSLYNYSSSF